MTIKQKERDSIVQALRAGVVPRLGLHHVQVGRLQEIEEMARDINRIVEGGSTIRFVIGEYGAGKTFFLNLIRLIAVEKKLVTIHADLAPDRRIHSTGGQARNLYAELIRNMSTRSKPDSGALPSIVERFIGDSERIASATGENVSVTLHKRLVPLQDMISGYDFANVIEHYWRAFEEGDENGKVAALRWLRGEYALKTEAREALNVRSIIDDEKVYDYLKLMACFVRLAGYGGLLIVMDEMVNLSKLVSAQARNQNYEQILRIINDVLQGNIENFGIMFGGTPEFLMDSRRGLYSYEALRSRLAENSFSHAGLIDVSGPVIRLQSLSVEHLYHLLQKLRHLYACGNESQYLISDDALKAFMQHCEKKIGDAYFRTPRNTIKSFIDLLSILDQNRATRWEDLLGKVEISVETSILADAGSDATTSEGVIDLDDLSSFKL